MEANESLITAKEAAQRLGVSRATLGRLMRGQRISFYRVGGRAMFSNSVLEEFKAAVFQEARHAKRLLAA